MSTQATGMYSVIQDWSVYATQLDIMHKRLSGNSEKEALAMRQQMAQSVVDAYNNDGDDSTNITLEEAMSYIDQQYQARTGTSIVSTIEETTKGADSFWNYVPIVNWFIDDTTAEDLYKIMEGKKDVNTNNPEGLGKLAGNMAVGAGVAAIGTYIGCCAAAGSFVPGIGTAIGAGVGLLVGLGAWGLDFVLGKK